MARQDVYDHPELLSSYPALSKKKIGRVRSGPTYELGGESTSLGDINYMRGANPEETLEAGLHEFQHNIQSAEGWGRGGDPDTFMMEPAAFKKGIKALNFAQSARRWLEYQAHAAETGFNPTWTDFRKIYKKNMGFYPKAGASVKEAPPDQLENLVGLTEGIITRLEQAMDPHKTYLNLAGEAEARNVARRMRYTKKQRREAFPYSTLDVDKSDLVYSYGKALMK
jgi:hypothetical protein